MARPELPRRLRYTVDGVTHEVEQDALLALKGNIVLLGEAGAGKTTMTKWLERLGHERCTARALAVGRPPSAGDGLLVVDALDEMPANRDGDAVDRVVRALIDAGRPRFLLTCRTAEWRAVTTAGLLAEIYGAPPLEVELLPVGREQAQEILAAGAGADLAADAIRRFDAAGTEDLLGTPGVKVLDLSPPPAAKKTPAKKAAKKTPAKKTAAKKAAAKKTATKKTATKKTTAKKTTAKKTAAKKTAEK